MKLVIFSAVVLVFLTFITVSLALNLYVDRVVTSKGPNSDTSKYYYTYGLLEDDKSASDSDEPVAFFKSLDMKRPSRLADGGASPLKNRVKGPADLGIYYINKAGVSCGGLASAQCSQSCGKLGYPVYWCYPQQCYCHYGNISEEDNEIIPLPTAF